MKSCPECHVEFEDTANKCPQHQVALQTSNVNPLIGVCLGERYQIISVIGSGGTGIVYLAHHLKMDRPIAIKMMHPHMVARPEALKRFYEEAKTVAQLKHHNIVTLYDFGIGPNNQPFLAMDYVEGPSLRKLLDQHGPIPLDQMPPILDQIIDGLAYAHTQGVVHRDLKPENIMITRLAQNEDKVSIVDFGLAVLQTIDKELAQSGNKKKKFIGSPYYMSPEQCLSQTTIDHRADVYSLAIVLYEILCGKLPYEAKSGIAMMDSHVHEPPTPFRLRSPEVLGLHVCNEITRVFDKAMAKDPQNRYQIINDFGIELKEALARDTVKWKAIKHRSVVTEQVLVHAQAPKSDQETSDYSDRQFLSRQAEIEAAYLNTKPASRNSKTCLATKDLIVPVPKKSMIVNLLRKMTGVCPPVVPPPPSEAAKPISECPYCSAIVPQGIQFCLQCQRKLYIPVKLSDTRHGVSFTHHKVNKLDSDVEETRSNIQSLRQQRTSLAGIQRILNYALAISVLLGGFVIIYNYFGLGNHLQRLLHLGVNSTR